MKRKKLFFPIFFLWFLVFSCSPGEAGAGCGGYELIPGGYRSQAENPVLPKSAQVRLTSGLFDYLETRLNTILSKFASEFLTTPDGNNPRMKFCVTPMYGTQNVLIDLPYGVCSSCHDDNKTSCTNTVKECNNGTTEGCEVIMTLKNFQLVPTSDGNNADRLRASGEILIHDSVKFAVDMNPLASGYTTCDMAIHSNENGSSDVPVKVDVDFILLNNSDPKSEITIKVVDFEMQLENHLYFENPECDGSVGETILGWVKGMILDSAMEQIETTITSLIDEVSDTMLCSRCIPDYSDNLRGTYHCATNAPATAYCGTGCSTSDDCSSNFTCQSGFCVSTTSCDSDEDCTMASKCELSTRRCVEAPFCMETENACWEQRLGFEGRLDAMSLTDMFLETKTQSWLNFYFNAGEYAKAENSGLSVGILGGLKGDWNPCVSPSGKTFNATVPKLTTLTQNQFGNSQNYHVGIGLSQYLLNQGLTNIYDSGALCLDLDHNISEFLGTSTFSLLIPSLNDMTGGENNSVMIAIRPKGTPIVSFGNGTVDENGDPVVDDALINLSIGGLNPNNPDDGLQLDFYAFIDERYVRILSAMVDLRIGANLDIDSQYNLVPVLPQFKLGENGHIRNIRIFNNEILRESSTSLETSLPAVIELALNMMPLGFDPIALPSFMGFGVRILDVVKEVQGTGETSNFIAIYGDLMVDDARKNRVDINISNSEIIAPTIKEMRSGVSPTYTLFIDANQNNVEYQYKIDNGYWSTFKKTNKLTISSAIFMLQGEHKIEVRGRVIGQPETLSKTITKKFVVDSFSPKSTMELQNNKIIINSTDNVTKNSNLLYSININNSGWSEYKKIDSIKIHESNEHILVELKTKDENGNESYVKQRFNPNKIASVVTENSSNSATGCSFSTTNSSQYGWWSLLMILVLFRKKLKVFLIILSFLIIGGCNDNSASGKCVTNLDCSEGEICQNNKCVEGLDCSENPGAYECSECYIPGRCGEDNPCNTGCECNELLGVCTKIEGYCDSNSDCSSGKECKNNRCVSTRCYSDSDCSGKDCSVVSEFSHPFCDTLTGACLCSTPCGGACQDGTFCCHDPNVDQCLTLPVACGDFTCDAGYEVVVLNEGTLNDVTCQQEGVQCECRELPQLKLGTIGKYAKSVLWGDKLLIAGYSQQYGDLVVGVYENGASEDDVKWYFIDGVPDSEITHGPTGPRGGVSALGDDVGLYTSIVVDQLNRVHIAYQDKTNSALKYALLEWNSETLSWSKTVTTIDNEGDTGYYTAISVDSENIPSIAYTVREYEKDNQYFTALKVAVAQNSSPTNSEWDIVTLDENNRDVPCNYSCATGKACLFIEEDVDSCRTSFRYQTYNSTDVPKNIPDNLVTGVTSQLTIPAGIVASEFRISLSITHTYRGDLSVKLISPDGRESIVFNRTQNDDAANVLIQDKLIQTFSGKDVSGVWNLFVNDLAAQDTGVINSWSIQVGTLLNNSPYCGASCQTVTTNCSETCAEGTICSNGVCLEEAKEPAVRRYLRTVADFTVSQTYSNGSVKAILYMDGIAGELKFVRFNTTTKTAMEQLIFAVGNSGYRPSIKIKDDIAHVTYVDGGGQLRYLSYEIGATSVPSMLVDDGLRAELFEIHQVGGDSAILPIESGVEIYYTDNTTQQILKRVLTNSSWGAISEFYSIFDSQNSYRGSFGFFLNVFMMGSDKVIPNFYYKLQSESGAEDIRPDSSGKIRVIKE
ncbi:proprotein convertase P-domain-containing protein [bacterium]|nr:proprotein convertase P-domain-containing protein [bacterium]